uniref:Uncharacterized protein n=1 Tax=Steinernema glaseri TaxID=37863 RepID=A0A1I8A0X4_9BILA
MFISVESSASSEHLFRFYVPTPTIPTSPPLSHANVNVHMDVPRFVFRRLVNERSHRENNMLQNMGCVYAAHVAMSHGKRCAESEKRRIREVTSAETSGLFWR